MLTLLAAALASPPIAVDADLSAVPRGLRIVAISNLASGCARDEDAECVQAAVTQALALSPHDAEVASWADHGLYGAHLLIILGEAQRVGLSEHRPLQEQVAEDLIAATRADDWHNPPSYAGDESRWPADQAAMLYGIHLYQAEVADELLEPWRTRIEREATDGSGLPWSELTGRHGYSTTPRGCALFWTAAYLAEVDPTYAQQLFTASSRAMAISSPVGLGMREYPAGRSQPADYDSGPIVMGVGAASSAFATAAAHALGASELQSALLATEARTMRLAQVMPKLAAAASNPMAQSIRYRWYRSP